MPVPLTDANRSRLVRRREELRLTQVQLAERVGTASQVINQIEHGKKLPSEEMLSKIAAALGLDVQITRSVTRVSFSRQTG